MPEAPARSTRLNELLRRLAALFYDLLLILGILMVTSFALVMGRRGIAVPAGSPFYQLFLLAQILAFFVGFWISGGQTPGMRSWRIRLEAVDGRKLGVRLALLRSAAALLSLAPAGLGFLWCLIDRDGRAWHDRLSHTRIVRAANRAGG